MTLGYNSLRGDMAANGTIRADDRSYPRDNW